MHILISYYVFNILEKTFVFYKPLHGKPSLPLSERTDRLPAIT